MTATETTVKAVVPDLEYTAEFVPQSKSRNAEEKNPTLNWRVTLKTPRGTLTTDYSQGIGHLPGYNAQAARSIGGDKYIKWCVENGKRGHGEPYGVPMGGKAIAPPTLTDVVYSVLADSEAIDFGTFDDWASEFGYDTDSRKAEAIYKACVDTGLKLRRILGDDKIAALREMFQDY